MIGQTGKTIGPLDDWTDREGQLDYWMIDRQGRQLDHWIIRQIGGQLDHWLIEQTGKTIVGRDIGHYKFNLTNIITGFV